MNNLWCTNYSSVRTNTRFTVLAQAQVNCQKVLVRRKFYLSQRTDNAQKSLTLFTCINSFKNSMKPAIISIENSVDPDQLASSSLSGSTQFSLHNKEFIIIIKYEIEIFKVNRNF